MCAPFLSDILVIISLGRYLYMFLFHIEEGPVKGARLARAEATPTLPLPQPSV